MKRSSVNWFLLALVAALLLGCTYAIKPSVPDISAFAVSKDLQPCTATLLLPHEFATRQFLTSFDAREIRVEIGPSAAAALVAVMRQRYAAVDVVNVSGDGTLNLLRADQSGAGRTKLIFRPRYQRLESSVQLGQLNFEIQFAVDIVTNKASDSISGTGVGTAYFYTQAELQRAADEALAKVFQELAGALPSQCP